jgi:hypothetical protein
MRLSYFNPSVRRKSTPAMIGITAVRVEVEEMMVVGHDQVSFPIDRALQDAVIVRVRRNHLDPGVRNDNPLPATRATILTAL